MPEPRPVRTGSLGVLHEQLEPVAPRIGRVEAADARERVVPLDVLARGLEPLRELVEFPARETEGGVRLPGRREGLFDAYMELAAAEREPDASARAQWLGLLEFLKTKEAAEEAARLVLAAGRRRQLHVIELDQSVSAACAGSACCSGFASPAPFCACSPCFCSSLACSAWGCACFAAAAAPPPFRLRLRRRLLRPPPCFGAGRFSASASATSWIEASRSRASSMSFVARGV